MDAGGGRSSARKRKAAGSASASSSAPTSAAAAALALRKKSRRSSRERSEFVSVEVGMREFKKRLASSATATTDSPAASKTGALSSSAVAADASTPAPKPKPTAAARAKAVTASAKSKAAPAAKPAAKKPAVPRKTPVRSAPKPAPAKRVTRQTKLTAKPVAQKLTLAEVKLQLEREQRQRVESRIQTLHHKAQTTARPSASVTDDSASQQQQQPREETAEDAAALPSPVQQAPEVHRSLDTPVQATAMPPVGSISNFVPLTAVERPPAPVQNEFIADDDDEDMMFMLALEEVERKLGSSDKPPAAVSETVVVPSASPTSGSSIVPVAAVTSSSSSQPALLTPPATQALSTAGSTSVQTSMAPANDAQSSQAAAKTEAPSVAMSPEVLVEMERLRQENELLRRSNELLQARASEPIPESKSSVKSSVRARNEAERATQESCAQTKPRARFLDLGRPRTAPEVDRASAFQENEPMSGEPNEQQDPEASGEHTAVDHSVEFSPRRLVEPEKRDDGAALASERALGDETAPQDTENVVEHRWNGETREADTEADRAPSGGGEDHESVCVGEKEGASIDAPVRSQADAPMETAGARLLSDYLSAEEVVDNHGRGALETTGSDDGDVSDANVSDAEDDEDDEDVGLAPKEPPQRASTIDTGNYAEYKRRENDEADAARVEHVDVDHSQDADVAEDPSRSKEDVRVAEEARDSAAMVQEDAAEARQGLETLTSSEVLGRTTAPSNTEDEDEDVVGEEDDEGVVAVKPKARLHVLPSSSSESESDGDDVDMEESDSDDHGSSNMLEAALKAAGSDSKKSPRVNPAVAGTTGAAKKTPASTLKPGQEGGQRSSARPVSSTTSRLDSTPAKAKPKQKPNLSTSSSSGKRAPASVRSSLLWPTLDEFYDFLLDLPPRNVRASDHKQRYLQQYAGGKLPTQHATVDDYCGLQLEAILEELVASVGNATESGGGSGPTRRLPLTSVSPCGTQTSSSSSLGLNTGVIFSESGFTGATCSSSDYILAFHASALGGKSSSDFVSGDLVLVRSPRWKSYELCTFGVVLCNSVVAVGSGKGGKGGKGGGGGGGNSSERDQLCVLVRAHKRGQEDTSESFAVLTELCLSNQRAPNWRWTLQQVHNTTTSAREFQAVKSVAFFPRDLTQVLLDGRLSGATGGGGEQLQAATSDADASAVLSPRLLKYLRGHYNESQLQAILGCLGAANKVIIQGPPGTGKTRTILGLLSALLDGAGLSTLQRAKGTARIRVGASLQSASASASSVAKTVAKTVAETSIRVLVAAPSNAAVDELVVRLLSEGVVDGETGASYRPRIVRVGRPESAQQQRVGAGAAREASGTTKTRQQLRKYAREVEEVLLESLVAKHRGAFATAKQARQAVLERAQLVLCTLSGAGSAAMCDFAQHFDALVVDEAAQAVEASTLIPLKFRPRRVVLVGDHRQLPATVLSKKLVRLGYDRSLLQRLVEKHSPVRLLSRQYRMHPAIAEFPSTYFYGGRLVQERKLRERTARAYHAHELLGPLVFLDVRGGTQSQVGGSTSLRNLSEVEAVVQLVRLLLLQFPAVDWRNKVGVIAPYKQQIHELRGAVARLEAACARRLDVEVNTVDGFQGREKDIIIYSCVRTSAAHGGGARRKKRKQRRAEPGAAVLDAFWADERRMNVAITRAKSSLWIVGNSALLSQSRAWDALIRHAKSKGSYVGDGAAALLAAMTPTPARDQAA